MGTPSARSCRAWKQTQTTMQAALDAKSEEQGSPAAHRGTAPVEHRTEFDAILDAAAGELLEQGSSTRPKDPVSCTRNRSCTCPLCDAGYAALADGLPLGEEGPLSVIWKGASDSAGRVYVGGMKAATSPELLKQFEITHV